MLRLRLQAFLVLLASLTCAPIPSCNALPTNMDGGGATADEADSFGAADYVEPQFEVLSVGDAEFAMLTTGFTVGGMQYCSTDDVSVLSCNTALEEESDFSRLFDATEPHTTFAEFLSSPSVPED